MGALRARVSPPPVEAWRASGAGLALAGDKEQGKHWDGGAYD